MLLCPSISTMTYYISITGIQLKGALSYPKFVWYTIPAMRAAAASPGNVSATGNAAYMSHESGKEKNTLFTLSVWNDRASAMKYVMSPEHRAAAKLSTELASLIKTYHYESESVPNWDEAMQLWADHGKEYNLKKGKDVIDKVVEQEYNVSSSSDAAKTLGDMQ